MSKSHQQLPAAGRWRRVAAAIAVSLLSFAVMGLLSPIASAQTNSPGPGQPSDSTPGPSQGGPSNQTGTNTGGDGQVGNRSTPGQGGATGGGAGAPASEDGGGSGAGAGIALAVLAGLIVVGAGVFVSGRQRRLERAEAT